LVTYADSSFLVSLYVTDSNSGVAEIISRKNPGPITLTVFSKYETEHAIRLLAYRKAIPHEVMARALLNFDRDQHEGNFRLHPIGADDLFKEAGQLSRRYALEIGVRYLDMLHVASALLVNAKRFLSFDSRQAKLAKALSLDIRP
jgi:predicted nucleic acid-binding protein